jgi:hypothetical protein
VYSVSFIALATDHTNLLRFLMAVTDLSCSWCGITGLICSVVPRCVLSVHQFELHYIVALHGMCCSLH